MGLSPGVVVMAGDEARLVRCARRCAAPTASTRRLDEAAAVGVGVAKRPGHVGEVRPARLGCRRRGRGSRRPARRAPRGGRGRPARCAREPLWSMSHRRSSSSAWSSMKWLPLPSVPSCARPSPSASARERRARTARPGRAPDGQGRKLGAPVPPARDALVQPGEHARRAAPRRARSAAGVEARARPSRSRCRRRPRPGRRVALVRDRDADADLLGEVDVRHHGDVLDVGRRGQTRQRALDVGRERVGHEAALGRGHGTTSKTRSGTRLRASAMRRARRAGVRAPPRELPPPPTPVARAPALTWSANRLRVGRRTHLDHERGLEARIGQLGQRLREHAVHLSRQLLQFSIVTAGRTMLPRVGKETIHQLGVGRLAGRRARSSSWSRTHSSAQKGCAAGDAPAGPRLATYRAVTRVPSTRTRSRLCGAAQS